MFLINAALGNIGAHMPRARTSYGVEIHLAVGIRPCMVASRNADEFQDHGIHNSRIYFPPGGRLAQECSAGVILYSSS